MSVAAELGLNGIHNRLASLAQTAKMSGMSSELRGRGSDLLLELRAIDTSKTKNPHLVAQHLDTVSEGIANATDRTNPETVAKHFGRASAALTQAYSAIGETRPGITGRIDGATGAGYVSGATPHFDTAHTDDWGHSTGSSHIVNGPDGQISADGFSLDTGTFDVPGGFLG